MKATRAPSGIGAALFSVMVVLTIIVVVQDTGAVQATVLFRTFSVPLALLLVLTLASGLLSGIVLYRRLSNRKHRG